MGSDFFIFPLIIDGFKLAGELDGGSAKTDAPSLGSLDALLLSFSDVFSLLVGDEGENLQDDVSAFFLGEEAPLVLDFFIVSAKAVNAIDVE